MDSAIQFVVGLLLVALAWSIHALQGVDLVEYFNNRTGKGILKGIVIVICLACGLAITAGLLSGCTGGTYLNDASIFVGLDYTKNSSPQCELNGPDDRTTSNVGARVNLYQSADERFRINGKGTHHSCAYNSDRNTYDALGAELEYLLWAR